MAGIAVDVSLNQLDKMLGRLDTLSAQARDPKELLDTLASLLEAQTKRRISDEKTAPDGMPWHEWSKEYAETRKPQHSLLIDTQSALDDIAGSVDGNSAVVGSSLEYMVYHQDSEKYQNTRPFLGLSEDNASEILDVVEAWLQS